MKNKLYKKFIHTLAKAKIKSMKKKAEKKERKDSFFETLTAEKYSVLKKFTKSLQNFSRAQRQMAPCSNISFTVLKE